MVNETAAVENHRAVRREPEGTGMLRSHDCKRALRKLSVHAVAFPLSLVVNGSLDFALVVNGSLDLAARAIVLQAFLFD